MKKRTIAVLLTMAMAATMMAGCGSKSDSKTADGEKSYTIGISQFAEHGSLDNCREGFLEGLKEEGIEEGKNLNVEYKNSAADMGTASQIASSFVSDKVDLICGIATPSAQTASKLHLFDLTSEYRDVLCVCFGKDQRKRSNDGVVRSLKGREKSKRTEL